MASTVSIDLAATFVGLAKKHPCPFNGFRTSMFQNLWRNKSIPPRSCYLACFSTNSGAVPLGHAKSKHFSRRFTASATTTDVPQSEDSDVLTKIPPDDRVPATIITGFLGSGKKRKSAGLMQVLMLESNPFLVTRDVRAEAAAPF